MAEGNDPRVYFAAERTLLAWLRTGLAVIGLGFVVARFGLFLELIGRRSGTAAAHPLSTLVGVVLVLLGVASVVVAARQHIRFCRTLTPAERPPQYWVGLGVWFAFTLAAAGAALAIYLLLRADFA